jgi:putative N-acetylmannosamine-6-phosphate epimerase
VLPSALLEVLLMLLGALVVVVGALLTELTETLDVFKDTVEALLEDEADEKAILLAEEDVLMPERVDDLLVASVEPVTVAVATVLVTVLVLVTVTVVDR